MKSTSAFSTSRIKNALRYSAQGLQVAWRQEAAFRQKSVACAVLVPTTLWCRLPTLDAVILLALMGIMLLAELLHLAIGALIDKVSPELHPLAGKARNCASAGVMLATITLLLSWLTLVVPAIFAKGGS